MAISDFSTFDTLSNFGGSARDDVLNIELQNSIVKRIELAPQEDFGQHGFSIRLLNKDDLEIATAGLTWEAWPAELASVVLVQPEDLASDNFRGLKFNFTNGRPPIYCRLSSLYQLITDLNERVDEKQDILTFDITPTADSNNPVTSAGIKAYVDAKEGGVIDEIQIAGETVPIENRIVNLPLSIVATSGNYSDLQGIPEDLATTEDISTALEDFTEVVDRIIMDALSTKQDILRSGENIKTINGNSILGSGDLYIQSSGAINWIDPKEPALPVATESSSDFVQWKGALYWKCKIPAAEAITTLAELPGTTWKFNDTLSDKAINIQLLCDIVIESTSDTHIFSDVQELYTINSGGIKQILMNPQALELYNYATESWVYEGERKIIFKAKSGGYSDSESFLTWLKDNATLQEQAPYVYSYKRISSTI